MTKLLTIWEDLGMTSVLDDKGVEAKILAFDNAIEGSERFKIKGVNEENDCFVIVDTTKPVDGTYGKYIEVSVAEVIEKPLDQLMEVLALNRKPIVCEGVTRIVGYYSRTHNWNKSKIGELRDRAQRNYGLTVKSPEYDQERMQTISNL